MDGLEILIGKTIESMKLSDDKKFLEFVTTEKKLIVFEAVGDCCSESWIEHLDEIPKGSLVNNVIAKDVNTIQEASYNTETYEDLECIQQYFYELVTDKGSFSIEMRNSSNGYYGGEIIKISENDYEEEA